MMELVEFLKVFAGEIIPGVFGVVAVSLAVFAVLVYLPLKARHIIRQVKWLWYVQAVVLVLVVFSLESAVLTTVDLDGVGRESVEQVGQTVLWLVGAFLANQALGLFVWEGVFYRKYKSAPPGLLTGLIAAGLYVFALYGVMTFVFERHMTGFIVSSGIVAGVLGLAMQNSLADLVAGVALSVERPFKIGDWVELDDGTLGEVVDINWRATHIKSWYNSLYILPNARISNARVHNFHRPEKAYGYWFFIHVPSTVPPTLVRRVLLQAAIESERVLEDPPPVIRVAEGGGSYKYMVYVHFESYPSYFIGVDDYLMHAWIQCARHGIVPSAVTSEVILRQGEAEEITEPSPQELLAGIELFSGLDEESRQLLVGGMKVHAADLSEEVVGQGDDGESLYVIAAGMVRVAIQMPEGESREVARLGAGDYFGEMSLLAGDPRTASVTAHTECQLLEIDKDALRPVFDKHPDLMETMARIVTERRLSNEAMEQQTTPADFAKRLNEMAASLLGRMKNFFG